MKIIKLWNKRWVSYCDILVDDIDLENIIKYNWYIHYTGHGDEIMAIINKKPTKLSNFIMNDYENIYDHINRNSFDNQRNNLRSCTHIQNQCNKGLQSNNTSGYKGVVWFKSRNKWRVQIKSYNKNRHLAYTTDLIEAARIYDKAAIKLHGEFASLNFPRSDYEF